MQLVGSDSMCYKSRISSRLRTLQDRDGRSQTTVAIDLGISRANYNGVLRGYSLPSVEVLIQLADYFDVSLDWLTGRDDFILKNHHM
jgi:transcriptional regulator with XRE-family HTH domain